MASRLVLRDAILRSLPQVKAKKGSWVTLTEWKWNETKQDYTPVCVKTEQVDGEHIKEDIYYELVNGEFQEVV